MWCRGLGLVCAIVLTITVVRANEPEELPPITLANAARLTRMSEVSVRASCVAWMPQTQQVLLCGWQEPLHIHDGRTLALIEELPTPRACTQFSLSTESGLLAWTAGTSTVAILDLNTGETRREFDVGDSPQGIALSPDGKWLATTGNDNLHLWEIDSGQRRSLVQNEVNLHAGIMVAAVFSPNSRRLAVHRFGARTQLYDLELGSPRFTLEKALHFHVTFSPDGTLFAAVGHDLGHDATLSLWDAETGANRGKEKTNFAGVHSVAWSPQGDLLATCGRDGPLQLWNPQTLKLVAELETGQGRLTQVSFSPDGTRLLTCGGAPRILANRTLTLWGIQGK